ncbi:MAG: hypothetical protein WD533_08815 [Dehalococcoidia bacterium]
MKLSLSDGSLHIRLEGMEKIWALKGSLTIPLADIAEVRAKEPDDKPSNYWKALRIPGTFVPWVIKAGTYYSAVGREFWYATTGKPFLVLYVNKEGKYDRVVLGLDDAEVWAQRIQSAKV